MNTYYIIVQRVPGDPRYDEHFDYRCETETQAWNYARSKARSYGPSARVKNIVIHRGEHT